MLIDCETCAARGPACSDCLIAFLAGPDDRADAVHDLTPAEGRAVAVLARSGLVPPLRLTPVRAGRELATGVGGGSATPGTGRGPAAPGDRCA